MTGYGRGQDVNAGRGRIGVALAGSDTRRRAGGDRKYGEIANS